MEGVPCETEAVGAILAASRGTLEATRWSPIAQAQVAEVEKERCIIFAVSSILYGAGSTEDVATRWMGERDDGDWLNT